MKKVLLILAALLLLCVLLGSCNQTDSDTPTCTHSESDWIVTTEPTCTVAGVKTLKCDVCGGKTETIPAKGHSWKDATCTDPKICTVCGTEDGAPAGHANTLQSDGSDICGRCNAKSYTTYSVKALTGLYQLLKSPLSATVHSVYAGYVSWEGSSCIAVVTDLSAQNGFGAMTRTSYLTVIDRSSGTVLSYDMVSAMMDQYDYYHDKADNSYGMTAVNYLDKAIEYLDKAERASNIIKSKTTKLEAQDVNYINQTAKENSGLFN